MKGCITDTEMRGKASQNCAASSTTGINLPNSTACATRKTRNTSTNELTQQQEPDSYLASGFGVFLKKIKAAGWFAIWQEDTGESDVPDSVQNTRSRKSSPGRSEYKTAKEDRVRFEEAVSILLRRPYSRKTVAYSQNPAEYTRIPLCQQLESWDCGIACIQMVLRWQRQDTMVFEKDTRKLTPAELSERDWMLQTVGTESIWTIDLILLMEKLIRLQQAKRLGASAVAYLFCSTNMGVDVSYNGLGYYRNAFQRDEVRVKKRFEEAQTMGLPTICVRHLGLEEVVDAVSKEDCIAIVLLDNNVLLGKAINSPPVLGMASNSSQENTACQQKEQSSYVTGRNKGQTQSDDTYALHTDTYAGHYIVLCGISFNPVDVANAEKNDGARSETDYCMVIKNPARCNEVEYITPGLFERAWRATGTDEDIVFVAKHCINE